MGMMFAIALVMQYFELPYENSSSKTNVPAEKATAAVVSISEMNDLLLEKPRWSSRVDQDLLNAKLQIENAPIVENDPWLYAPLYRNVSMFKRSYELTEHMLKVYIHREGQRPILRQPVLKGIYAAEGWYMKLLKGSRQFVTKTQEKAHLFYLPFSSRMLEETLYVPNSHSHKNLIQHLKNYLDIIVGRYSFWNRTGGADHFLVACHDWAPSETNKHIASALELFAMLISKKASEKPLRIFYESLSKQIPSSEMAEFWMMEHGMLSTGRAKKAYEKKQLRQKQLRMGTPIKSPAPLPRSKPEISKKQQQVSKDC
ncbi:putative glycosyltransferase [Camellia lanceoleosa]|uniref:Glycosyltransferase n=1 Tax=Camellia lanceoleosa TaxID=1840588 RepID=A0ACC0GAY0_9ERIC|nr:putative glycosyltransferase [Camellia lanceoleosa]